MSLNRDLATVSGRVMRRFETVQADLTAQVPPTPPISCTSPTAMRCVFPAMVVHFSAGPISTPISQIASRTPDIPEDIDDRDEMMEVRLKHSLI